MILPIRTDSPLRSTPWMNWALLAITFGMGVAEVCEVLRRYREETDLPLFVRSNMGTPEEFARMCPRWVAAGASMVGGCCGTTEEHIAAMAASCATRKRVID